MRECLNSFLWSIFLVSKYFIYLEGEGKLNFKNRLLNNVFLEKQKDKCS